MRNLLAFLAAAALAIAGLGWYFGWYTIGHSPSTSGRHNISIDIDSKKISEDVSKGVKKSEQKLHQWLDQEPGAAATKSESVRHESGPVLPNE